MCVLSTSIFLSSIRHFLWIVTLGHFPECGVGLSTLNRCKILRRHLLMKVCILFSVFCVLHHVSNS